MIWFTSDLHLGHWNIARYCGRPFKDLKSMDDTLIARINERVKPEDTLFHLGDFCFSHSTEASDAPKKPYDYYRNLIGCRNIIFIRGNHDKNNSVKTCIQSVVISHGGKLIKLTHKPEHAEGKYELNFVGHIHNTWAFKQQTFGMGEITTLCNVGVDVHNFYPVTYGEIISKLSKWRKSCVI
jgi:calcineurin-like phosphoesterase family protein